MISRYFIDRPILAAVLSILIFSIGCAAIALLPVDRFPEITPPVVGVHASYPGADAQTVAESVAAPIEQELSGIENLLYFQAYSDNSGGLNMAVTFDVGTDIDLAAVEIQNRLSRAEPRLPQETVRNGITVEKASNSILMVIALKSTNPQHTPLFLSNYAKINVIDEIKRVAGVGNAQVFGANDYSMRVWANPELLASRNLTVVDVANAIREQNGLYAAGRIGAEPLPGGAELTLPVVPPGRLEDAEDFESIVLRANPDGSFLRLGDVARLELGAAGFDQEGRQNGEAATMMLAFLQPGANALEVSDAVKARMEELGRGFPEGMFYAMPFDTTPFIRAGIEEVRMTFIEAMTLVSLVVLVFLGTWRGTVIPLAAVPVAIIGTFIGMLLLGFSINSLTLFGLVLAIGIVVDDAIIVVENVERIMEEEHLRAREATIKAMEQVSGPIIAIVLVLSSVFIPVGFMGGLTGELYRQFAVTIAISVIISGFVALTLSPALCVVLLAKQSHRKIFIFRWFDRAFAAFTEVYKRIVRLTIRWAALTVGAFVLMLLGTLLLFKEVPGSFIPQEDQGFFIIALSLPPGASLDRTVEVMKKAEQFVLKQKEVDSIVGLAGMDMMAGQSMSTSAGIMFASLTPWEKRHDSIHSVDNLTSRTTGAFGGLKEGFVIAINPPAIFGLGLRGGFEFQLKNRPGAPLTELSGTLQKLIAAAEERPEIQNATGGFNVALPQMSIELDRDRAMARGVSMRDAYDSLQSMLGSLYVNDFMKYGRIYRVQMQAEADYRKSPDQLGRIYVRNATGGMIPLSDLVRTKYTAGPNVVARFNGSPSVQLGGEAAPGYSTGDAIAAMEAVAREVLPPGYGFEWSGASLQEIKAGSQAPYVLGLGLFIVFLVLSALYERWTLPLAVLLGIPAGAFGALMAIYLRGMPRDIYFQVGMLTLIGLSAKNAILIVEFASELRKKGMSIAESAIEASRVRLRPFIMTSLAFILGVMPLAFATGAGAAARRSIGTGVAGGMLAATFLGMLFVPIFFVIVQGMGEGAAKAIGRLRHHEPHAGQGPGHGHGVPEANQSAGAAK